MATGRAAGRGWERLDTVMALLLVLLFIAGMGLALFGCGVPVPAIR